MESSSFPTVFPVLETKRLTLRAVRAADADAIFAIRSNPDVFRYCGAKPYESREQAEHKIVELDNAFRAESGIRWGLVTKEDGRLIGSAGYWRMAREHFRSEIGYELAPDVWGKGYMVEALEAILRYGFAALRLHSVEADVEPSNAASVRVLEKLGFQREGLIRENFFFEGKFYDTLIYSLLKRGLMPA